MKKKIKHLQIPDYVNVFVDSRATETISVRLIPKYRKLVEDLAEKHETSLTGIVLWGLSLLPHTLPHPASKAILYPASDKDPAIPKAPRS